MGIKNFHIFFIVTCLVLMSFLVYWSGRNLAAGQDGFNIVMAVVSGLGFIAGISYLSWFLKKTKSL
ncbi:MAG: hypothetical protein HY401_04750 [Elusimicrobia bacterium]|nr:hypothetical protein [Elusimicrobiota bacterium]